MATTLHAATVRKMWSPLRHSFPWSALLPTIKIVGKRRSNDSIVQIRRAYFVDVSSCTNRFIPISLRYRFATYNRTRQRNFFNVKNIENSTTTTQSEKGKIVSIRKNEPELARSTSHGTTTTTAEEARRTSRNAMWNYTKQFSSRLYTTVKSSSQSSLNWLGAKIASSVRSNVSQIRERAHTSIETTYVKARQRIQDFRNNVSSNIQESTKSVASSISAPFQSGWNYVASVWRTTPVWNRFFWWSLSAIAVYGIATTLPAVLIKLTINQTTTSPTTTTKIASNIVDKQTPKSAEDKTPVVHET